ncbi:patatin-like phospholipase family protein [Stenotrophomonas maltophilia]|uniref:patatin-like phospholipase family protein n=1 Tax=Stenotrophomonas maltophilia TaxID=40324 RepID=UPI0012AEE881|nr:patatin-like phospholipase family protein [Stenotrophomonas maltophilia]QGM05628.1 patatin family protein [Stenotrophomonas maltophilia]
MFFEKPPRASTATGHSSPGWCQRGLRSLLASVLPGCASATRSGALPQAYADAATPAGIENARYWLDTDIEQFVRSALNDLHRAGVRVGDDTSHLDPVQVLAISGGGENGAFAAGLLSGWTAHGDRPQFRVVTGISAGALIAPFAFLGPSHDGALREATLAFGRQGIFRSRGIFGLASDGFADNRPALRFVARYVTPQMLQAIATEYRKGRALMIGTTELDSGRAATWNMGAIAASGSPQALRLFRQVMVASASIPGAVSPVMIDVHAAGHRFQEMHVDGGVSTQVFAYPTAMQAVMQRLGQGPYRGRVQLYVVLNGRVTPDWTATPRQSLAIGGRALRILLQRQAINDLERIYRTAHQDGADYNLAYIGPEFHYPRHKRFDEGYMHDLFDHGYRSATQGDPWQKCPEGWTVQPHTVSQALL